MDKINDEKKKSNNNIFVTTSVKINYLAINFDLIFIQT